MEEEEEEEEKGRYGKEDLKLLGARGSHQPRQTSESARVLSKTLNC